MKTIGNYQKKFMLIAAAFMLSAVLVALQPAIAADVQVSAGGLTITPDVVANFEVMKVRIAGPSGDLVLDAESTGESVGWSAAGMPDGTYQYEAVVLTYNPDLDTGEEDGDDGERLERTWGSVQVANGQIVVPKQNNSESSQDVGDQSLFQKLGKSVVRIAMGVMDLIVPSAHAQDLTISNGVNPKLNFNETDGGFNPDWVISANGDNATDFPNCGGVTLGFAIFDNLSNNCRKVLELEDGANSTNTFLMNTSGDITLANSAVFIDRSAAFVGIGTNTPGAEIEISAISPEIELFDESDNSDIDIVFNSPNFTIEGDFGQDVFEMHKDAPAASLQIVSNGDIGMGTTSPLAALEVRRSGNAVILVDDNGPQLKRQMFILENNGAPSFRFRNALSGRAWTFAMTDNFPFDEFVINDPNSPGRELFLDSAGNMAIKGNFTAAGVFYPSDRNLKENIEPLDGQEVLRKVMALPISSWSFKNDSQKLRHIGPMAQDFQKVFGSGPDDRHIPAADSSGIALAAIQGLGEMVKAKDAEIAQLKAEIAELRTLFQQAAMANQVAMIVE